MSSYGDPMGIVVQPGQGSNKGGQSGPAMGPAGPHNPFGFTGPGPPTTVPPNTDPSGGGGSTTDPINQILSLPVGVTQGANAAQYAGEIATYLRTLDPADYQKAMQQLVGTSKSPGPIQGTPLATALYQNLQGGMYGAGGAGRAGAGPGFDPFGLAQAFQTTIPNWLSGQEKQSAALNKAGDISVNQALAGASPQIQAAYKAIMPGEQQAAAAETQTMADLALVTPQFNEMVAGIQALNQAYTQAKTAAAQEPYIAAAVQGTAMPGSTSQANALTAGLQGPGIPAQGSVPGPTGNVATSGGTPVTNPASLANNPQLYYQYLINQIQNPTG